MKNVFSKSKINERLTIGFVRKLLKMGRIPTVTAIKKWTLRSTKWRVAVIWLSVVFIARMCLLCSMQRVSSANVLYK